MAEILVRGLTDEVIERLTERANRAGRSLQSEAKLILEQAIGPTLDESLATAAAWHKKLGKQMTDSVEMLREDRQR